ncbi:MAG TPA: hypothetical protein VMD29_11140 [Terracidiphilus sp.]|nr:hypothetical protein [Terracidiphilus sp.]
MSYLNLNLYLTTRVLQALALEILLSICSAAQTATVSPTSVNSVVLREGTDVRLKFAEPISSKTAALDDPVTLILDDDVKVGDIVVAKAGAKAFATVTNVKKAGMLGKGGELNIRLESMKAGDVRVHLRGSKGREGENKTGAVVALTVLFGPIGLIKHGKNIEIPAGTPLTAYVADDATIPISPSPVAAQAPGQ